MQLKLNSHVGSETNVLNNLKLVKFTSLEKYNFLLRKELLQFPTAKSNGMNNCNLWMCLIELSLSDEPREKNC